MKKTKPKAAGPARAPKPVAARITDLAQLTRLVREAIEVQVSTPRGSVTMAVEPLTATLMGKVDDLLFVALPAMKKDDKGTEIPNPEYQVARRAAGRLARAFAIWHAVPLMRTGAPDGTGHNPGAIQAWLEGQVTDSVLSQLWTVVQQDFVRDQEVEGAADHFTVPA